jgi:hypothetical protein
MSWSVSCNGMKSDEAATQIERQFESMSTLLEPEETIKQKARALIADSLAGNSPVREVTVSAFGSMNTWTGEGGEQRFSNTVNINIS